MVTTSDVESGAVMPPLEATVAVPVVYPESDGEPLGETEYHAAEIVDTTLALRDHFALVPDIYVWMNMFVYYEEGNPRAVVAPDVFVVKGVAKLPRRRIYKVWEEGVPPTVVFEITSDSTRDVDLTTKRERYERIGVQEYFLFDPLGDYLRPPLQGFRRVDDRLERMTPRPSGSLVSTALGLQLRVVDGRLRLFDNETGSILATPTERTAAAEALAQAEAQRAREEEQRAAAAQARADAETARADAETARADAETARAEAEAERAAEALSLAQAEAARAEAAIARAAEAKARAEAEAAARRALEAEIAALRAQLGPQRGEPTGT